jgi:hypothetical protein
MNLEFRQFCLLQKDPLEKQGLNYTERLQIILTWKVWNLKQDRKMQENKYIIFKQERLWSGRSFSKYENFKP